MSSSERGGRLMHFMRGSSVVHDVVVVVVVFIVVGSTNPGTYRSKMAAASIDYVSWSDCCCGWES